MIKPVRYTSPLKEVSDYIVLDTETTGVDPEKDKIIEVGLIEVRNNKIVDRFGSFVNPGRHIPAAASQVNHIFDVDVAGAPTYEQIAPVLARWLIGKVVVAHNAKFDLTLVKNLLERFGYSGNIRYIDTLFYSRRAVDGVENYKLQTLAAHFGIDPGSAHRAVDDAVTCHYIFQECKRLTRDDSFSQKPVRSAYSAAVPAKDVMPPRSSSSRKNLPRKTQSTGAMIAKIVFGVLFIIAGFSSPETGWSWGYFFTAFVMGGALIVWGLFPYLKAKRQAAAAKAEKESLKRELLNKPKICKACGATSKGACCEYCGTKLE